MGCLADETRIIAVRCVSARGWGFSEEASRVADDHAILRLWLGRRRLGHVRKERKPRDADIGLCFSMEDLIGAPGQGPVANLREIYLPPALQRQGLGTELVMAWLAEWARLGVREVHAHVGSEPGGRALARWGFLEAAGLLPGLERRWRALDEATPG